MIGNKAHYKTDMNILTIEIDTKGFLQMLQSLKFYQIWSKTKKVCIW